MIVRWLKFNAVGAIGIVVQLSALAVFKSLLGFHYLVATGLAVEIAVLHNFTWHEQWTWKDRTGKVGVLGRLLRFNLTTGALSILSNLVFMQMFVGVFHLPLLPANLLSIGVTALANFAVSEVWVFR